MPSIIIQNLTCGYKVKKKMIVALDDVSLILDNSKINVIIGESGCGKTTLLKCIMGLEEHDGDIFFDKENVTFLAPKDRNLSYVSQDIVLYPHMSVFQNIAYPLNLIGAPVEEIRNRVNDVAFMLGISQILSRKPKQISLGQAQRVAIGRAIAKNPLIYIFDEPFSNLDVSIRESIRIDLVKLMKEMEATCIFVTHDIKEAFTIADKIFVMYDGKVVESGNPKDLLSSTNDITKNYLKELIK